MLEALGRDAFANYWFAGTAIVAIRGAEEEVKRMLGREREGREAWGKEGEGRGQAGEEEVDWEKVCLGTCEYCLLSSFAFRGKIDLWWCILSYPRLSCMQSTLRSVAPLDTPRCIMK